LTVSVADFIADRLTPQQAAAALDSTREVLCLACAGSGKSRTLATRVARLISEGVPAESLVAFTFTEKAADSIKRRIAEVLEECGFSVNLIGRMYIGTIHSFCQNVLGAADARYRQFDVLDDNRLSLFLMSRYPSLHLQPLRARASGQRYFETIREVASAWKVCQDEGILVEEIAEADPELGIALTALRDALNQDQYMDFGSMIRLVVELAHNRNPAVLRELGRITHLLVDEYQDVSPSQEALIRAIHGCGANIFVVGDDDQAIYSWRGADVSNILTFAQRYPGTATHTLETNYRSTRAIVAVASQFIQDELGAERLAKNPVHASDPALREAFHFHFADRDHEAEWVTQRISQLLGTRFAERDGTVRGLTYGDFAILMRSTRSAESAGFPRHFPFTSRLANNGIRYILEAGGGPFDRPQVEVLRKTFSLLSVGNPDRNEARAFFDNEVLPAYPAADFRGFTGVLSDWGRRIHAPQGGVRQRLFPQKLLFDLLGTFGIAGNPLPPEIMQEIGLFSRMMQDVEAVYLSVDSTARFQQVARFLEFIADGGYNSGTDDVVLQPDAVTVGTVHSVKGLEFPVVFIVDTQAGRFPANRSSYQGFLPPELIQPAVQRGAYIGTRHAEARLFYTALTRAEAFLYVSGSEHLPGGKKVNRPSEFSLRLQDAELKTSIVQLNNAFPKAPSIPRVDDNTLPTSFSDIRYYLHCPKDYRFRRNWGFSPPVPELFGFGRAVHVAVEKLHELHADTAPTSEQAAQIASETFHLKHVAASGDPVNRPGAYERAKAKAISIVEDYVGSFSGDFSHQRQIEARFEIPAQGCLITGSIDLLIRDAPEGNTRVAEVIDFKAMEAGEDPINNDDLDWTALSLQVQLYAKAAREVLGENAAVGSVHLLKDNQRIEVPIDPSAIDAAVQNVEWAVRGILSGQFPGRPHPDKCGACDFSGICPRTPEAFDASIGLPPPISTPAGPAQASVFALFQDA
jgi:DNA helicase-2/ATP-dependent DNA helicase PcrA